LDAQFDAGIARMFPDMGPGWNAERFFMWSFYDPTHYVNISSNALQGKINAYLAHKSQCPDPITAAEAMTNLAERMGNLTYNPAVSYAECFIAYF